MNLRNDVTLKEKEEENVKLNQSPLKKKEKNEPITPAEEGTETEKPIPNKEGNPKKQ